MCAAHIHRDRESDRPCLKEAGDDDGFVEGTHYTYQMLSYQNRLNVCMLEHRQTCVITKQTREAKRRKTENHIVSIWRCGTTTEWHCWIVLNKRNGWTTEKKERKIPTEMNFATCILAFIFSQCLPYSLHTNKSLTNILFGFIPMTFLALPSSFWSFFFVFSFLPCFFAAVPYSFMYSAVIFNI